MLPTTSLGGKKRLGSLKVGFSSGVNSGAISPSSAFGAEFDMSPSSSEMYFLRHTEQVGSSKCRIPVLCVLSGYGSDYPVSHMDLCKEGHLQTTWLTNAQNHRKAK